MSGPRTNAAFYAAPVEEFLAAREEEVYAPLASPHGYTLAPEQQSAWRLQLPVLRAARRWTEKQRRGTERAGLVASSSASAAQAPRNRHSGDHRPGALVSEPRERHPLVALSRRRGDGVSAAGAGARLDDTSRGTPTCAGRTTTGAITVFAGPTKLTPAGPT